MKLYIEVVGQIRVWQNAYATYPMCIPPIQPTPIPKYLTHIYLTYTYLIPYNF